MKKFSQLLVAVILITFLCFSTGKAQSSIVLSQQAVMDSTAFDFWLGEWNVTWTSADKIYHATNTITRKMNGHFIHESFEILDGPSKGFKGESFSTLDRQSGLWKQTWIDNQGAYLDFIGNQEGDAKIFERSFTNKAGENIRQRMVFRNIKKDGFDWDWQSSKNGGEWKMLWQLRYVRKA